VDSTGFTELDDLWPTTPSPGIGHNRGPALLDVQLAQQNAALEQRRDELLGAFDRAPAEIDDEDASKKVADLVRLIASCRKAAETNRVGRKEPYLAAARLIDAYFRRITDPLDKAKKALEERLTAYQRRVALAERQRRAEATPAELSRVRGEYGAVASLHREWTFGDLDRNALDLETLRPYFAVADLEKAVRAFIRAGGRSCRGVRIFETTTTRVR